MSDHKEPAITFRDVDFSYVDGRGVIDHANFEIQHGEAVCVVGPNGGGKTTLLKLILGSIKPKKGEVLVYGRPVYKERHRIAYVPQRAQFDALFPASVRDVVASGVRHERWWSFRGRKNSPALDRAMEAMRIESLGDKLIGSLSGGELQRVIIARALASVPDLLLLDEPTSNADPSAENVLLELLSDIDKEITVVMVSHNLDFVSRYVEKVVCVHGHVHLHPTHELSSAKLDALYGREIRMVRHDLSLGDSCGHE